MKYSLRHILKTWFESIFRHVDYFFPKNSKITTFPVYFEIVIPIDEDPDGKILSSSRLELIGSRSDRFKAVHSRSISPRVLEYKWLIEKLCRKKDIRKWINPACSMELFICRCMHETKRRMNSGHYGFRLLLKVVGEKFWQKDFLSPSQTSNE